MKNDCTHIEPLLYDYSKGAIDAVAKEEIEKHLIHCKNCPIALEEYTLLMDAFAKTPEMKPPLALTQNFEAMLLKEKAAQEKTIPLNMGTASWKNALRIAAGIALIATAFFIGNTLQTNSPDTEIVGTETRSNSHEQIAALSLIENRSASKRVQGVYTIEDFSEVNSEIIDALIKRMNEDEHTNVRLAAVEALGKFNTSEIARQALIDALNRQSIPEVQIAIIQILGNFKEKRAAKSAQQLLDKEDVPAYVKDQVRLQLPNLI
jgi:hypothetical protein